MKWILRISLIVSFIAIGTGTYLENYSEDPIFGMRIVGIGVFILAFIWMPVFIYTRYKDRNLSDINFEEMEENIRKNMEDF